MHLRQDTGFGSSGRPLQQATEQGAPISPPLAPAALGSAQADTWQRAPGQSAAGESSQIPDFHRSLWPGWKWRGHKGGEKLAMGEAWAPGQQVRGEKEGE